MYQAVDKQNLVLSPPESDYAFFSKLNKYSNDILFLHPTSSLFFDNLTINRYIHTEAIVSSEFSFKLPRSVRINQLSPVKMEPFNSKAEPVAKPLEFILELGKVRFKRRSLKNESIFFLEKISNKNNL